MPDPGTAGALPWRMARPSRLFLLALLILPPGCRAPAPPQPPGPPVARVRIADAERSSRPVLTEIVGTVRSTRSATIAPLIGGTIAEMRVGLGSQVRAGEVLVTLSARDVEARLEQSRVLSAQADRDRTRATLLKEQGAISVAQFETTMSQWQVAEARRAEASSIADRRLLRAPFAGVVTAKLASSGDTALPGQAILVLEAPSALRFEAQVPEAAGSDLRVGDTARVSLDGLEHELGGRIAEIQPASDDATRTRLVKIDLPETPGLRSGRFGRLLLPGAPAVAVTVPSGALVHRGQLESVFVVEGGRARLRLVRSGRERDGRTEISSGLGGGERVVVAGAAELVDGRRVEEGR